MTIIGATLAILFVDPPWRYLIIAALLATDVVEIMIWLRWRKKKSITGIETMVGAPGRAVSAVDPEGQVEVRGQLWTAHSDDPIDAGDDVIVTAVQGLKLEVARTGGL